MTWKKHPFPWDPSTLGEQLLYEKNNAVFFIQQIQKFRSIKSSGWTKAKTTNKQNQASTQTQMACPKVTNEKPWAYLSSLAKQEKTNGSSPLLTPSLLLDTDVAAWMTKEANGGHLGSPHRAWPRGCSDATPVAAMPLHRLTNIFVPFTIQTSQNNTGVSQNETKYNSSKLAVT